MTPVAGAHPLGLSTDDGRDHFDLEASLDLRQLSIPPARRVFAWGSPW